MFPSVLFKLNWKRYISNFWKITWLQTDISCLTPHRQTYQSFSLSVVISVPVSAADSWETRQRPFQKVTSQHSTSSLSFTPLTAAAAPPPPPVPLSVSLDVDNGIFCGQVTKTERMWVCVRLCVCPPPYCHRLSGPERERESDKVTAGPYFSLPLWSSRGHKTWCDCREGRREGKKNLLLLLEVPQPLWRFSFVKNSNPFFFFY